MNWKPAVRARVLSLLAIAAAIPLVVAACGGGAEPTARPQPTSGPTPTAAPAASPTAAPTATPAPQPAAATKSFRFTKWVANAPNLSLPLQRGGTARIIEQNNPLHLDTTAQASVSIVTGIGPVYNRLVRCAFMSELEVADAFSCQLHGDAAQSWTVSADGATFTFKLFPGIKWQNLPPVNGRPLTADDVVFSINEYRKSPVYASDYSGISDVSAPDPGTVAIKLKAPNYDFLGGTLADVKFRIVPHEIKEQDGNFRKTAVGTGPFILREFTPDTRLIFERNPNYHVPGRPYLDRIEQSITRDEALQRAAYRAGQVLYARPGLIPQTNSELGALLRDRPDSRVSDSEPDGAIYQLAMRLDKAPWNNAKVRQAMAQAIDHQKLIDTLWEGNARLLPVIPWIFWSDSVPTPELVSPFFKYDPDKAKALFAEAGASNLDLQVAIYAYNSNIPLWAQAVQDMLKKVGTKMTIATPEFAKYSQDINSGNYESAAVGFAQTASGIAGYTLTMTSGNGRNIWRLTDPRVDKLVSDILASADPAKQKQLLVDLVKLEGQEIWRVPLPQPRSVIISDPKLQNFFGQSNRGGWPHFGSQEYEVIWVSK